MEETKIIPEPQEKKHQRSFGEFVRRSVFLLTGLMVMSFGIALSIKAELGTSPISSLPCAVNAFVPLSVGMLTIIMHFFMVFLQIILMRRRYHWIQLLQIPVGICFGLAIDCSLYILNSWIPSSYIESLLVCLISIVIVAFGVSCEVTADGVPLAGEGLVIAICRTFGTDFGKTKISVDLSLVVLAVAASLIFAGYVVGVREGTLLSAFLVGILARPLIKWEKQPLEKFFCGSLNKTK